MLWNPDQTDSLDRVVERARSGIPTLFVAEGAAGTGKTALLDELVDRASGFVSYFADGLEIGGDRAPYSVLAQWGADVPRTIDGAVTSPFVAAQRIRELIDDIAADSPVLLRIDDLQWADHDSVEALTWLLRRAAGDRLLACVGTRPLPPETHPAWQRWAAGRDHSVRVAMSGLRMDDATTLARRTHPRIETEAVRALWEHTGGNPLYLNALLAEHDPKELAEMRVLPAPAEFAQLLAARLARLPRESLQMLRATAVLGTGWLSLPDVSAVAGHEVAHGLQPLIGAELVQCRTTGPGDSVRVAHALIRSAVYQQIPLSERREMHLRAAEVVIHQSAEFEHRIAAAGTRDDGLADRLERYATSLHDERSHRLAAQQLRSASTLTSNLAIRERRWLDSLFDSLLAQDSASVRLELHDVAHARDQLRATLILGALAIVETRWDEGVRILTPIASQPTGDDDPIARYRLEVLLAFAGTGGGLDTEQISAAVTRADALPEHDDALAGYALLAAGVVVARRDGTKPLVDGLRHLPDRPENIPLEESYALTLRGVAWARMGRLDPAIDDLSEAHRRMQTGMTDVGNGSFPFFLALLGQAHWLRGNWDLARVTLRLALDASDTFVHPIAFAVSTLVDSVEGNFAEADRRLDQTVEILHRMPWQEAREDLLVSQVVRLHAGGSSAEQAALLDSFGGTVEATFASVAYDGADPWLLHAALACIWSGSLDDAELAISKLRGPDDPGDPISWSVAIGSWLTALVTEARGDRQGALAHLDAAIVADADQVPLYRAHILFDHARVASLLGREAVAQDSLRSAGSIYRSLGAAPYVQRAESLLRVAPPSSASDASTLALSGRERDVLSLVITGLSYAQIARELFITQSTVSYHLGNIYAKANVTSRHELTDIVRSDPHMFGLSATLA